MSAIFSPEQLRNAVNIHGCTEVDQCGVTPLHGNMRMLLIILPQVVACLNGLEIVNSLLERCESSNMVDCYGQVRVLFLFK